MKTAVIVQSLFVLLFVLNVSLEVSSQPGVDLPVQLGFPVLAALTRIARFIKRLGYIFNPATYRARNRRELALEQSVEPFDAQEVEKYIVGEFGARACVFERVCAHYAARAQSHPRPQLDWPDVFSQYKRSPDQAKEYYLLSVFLGDIVGSPQLCHQLGKRRSCDTLQLGDF